ncbi:MAG: hypothetical protein KUL82_01040 [Bdellovibrio sp.]|nr:hypothetical protein [Bdellovibrio sp.]
MKRWIFFFLTSLLFQSLAWAEGTQTEGQESYGGNGAMAEFRLIATDLQRIFSYVDPNSFPSRDFVEKFKLKWKIAELAAKEQLFLHGSQVDAINYPYRPIPLIEISLSRWTSLSTSAKYNLVLHEMMPIVGYIDDKYQYSNPIILSLRRQGLLDLSMMEIVERSIIVCDKEELQHITFAYVMKSNAKLKEIRHLYQSAMAASCVPVAIYMSDLEFKYSDLSEEGISYMWRVIQDVLRSDDQRLSRKMEFLRSLVQLGFPTNELNHVPELSRTPVSAFYLLAQVENSDLHPRTLEIFDILNKSHDRPVIHQVDVETALKKSNSALADSYQSALSNK